MLVFRDVTQLASMCKLKCGRLVREVADSEVVVTEGSGHARQIMLSLELSAWGGVVVVSGDGLVAEIFRGLFDRTDWQDSLAHLAVSAVPVGRRNAFAR